MSQVSSQSEFEFRDVILSIPERDIEVDISLSILELVLYESINVPYITGKILCADTQGFFQALRMDGTERLRLQIVSTEFDYTFTRNFIMTRTIGKVPIGESGHAYNFYIVFIHISICHPLNLRNSIRSTIILIELHTFEFNFN